MIYLLIVIVVVIGVLLHSDTSPEITSSEKMSQDEWDQMMSSDSGE